ncbi:MAG: hypothetical protein MPJ78_18470 [Hyphomicrobiaceae bacterium]|nr:hypothetical protein [Hyphomicrobiaceae bacterium]
MKRRCRTCLVVLIASIAMTGPPAGAAETTAEGQTVPWWTPPGETDVTAYAALILLFLLLYAVFHFYARFDRFAERHNEGTPLKTTIPTLLMIAFAYEIFPPIRHFSALLPLALIATALARDLMLWFEPMKEHTLKGEIEGALLEELQRKNIGEHDRHGRRVQPKPAAKSPPEPEPAPPPRTAKAAPAKTAKAGSRKKTPVKQAAPAAGGSDRD